MPNGLSSGFTNTFRLRSAHYMHAVATKTFACSYEPRLENTYSQSFDRRVQCWQMLGRCGWSTAIRRHVSSLSGRSLPTSIWPEGVTTDSYWRWVAWTSRSSASNMQPKTLCALVQARNTVTRCEAIQTCCAHAVSRRSLEFQVEGFNVIRAYGLTDSPKL